MPAITDHPCFPQPEDADTKIWRYMDLPKLLWMLEENALYFCRVDLLEDTFEGTRTPSTEPLINEDRCPDLLKQFFREERKARRSLVFVNCWYFGDHESVAMWKIYGKENKSIAVQSTYRSLFEQLNLVRFLENEELVHDCFLGLVSYIDYTKESLGRPQNLLSPFMHKRESFAFEKEVRALVDSEFIKNLGDYCAKKSDRQKEARRIRDLYARHVKECSGITVPVDLSALIESIYVAPKAELWFVELVEKVIRRYGLNVPVKHSSLDADPLY